MPPNEQILTALSLFEWLKNHGNFQNVEFFFSKSSEYKKNNKKLNARFKNTCRVKAIKQQHFVEPLSNVHVICKTFSNDTGGEEMSYRLKLNPL